MSENSETSMQTKTSFPTLPIELKHYGAISAYIGFFSLLISTFVNNIVVILFSLGLIMFGIGSLKRRPLLKKDYLENGQWFTSSYYFEHSFEILGGILMVIGIIAILISIGLVVYTFYAFNSV